MPPLLHTYNDYVEEQPAWLERPDQRVRLSAYVQYLADAPLLLPLPIDHPRSGVPSFHGVQQGFSCGSELTRSLMALSQRTGVAPSQILLAAWNILLYRYTRQEPVVLGIPGTGRSDDAFPGVVGCFSTIVVWQSPVRADQSFLDVLDQFEQEMRRAQSRQDLPIESPGRRAREIAPTLAPILLSRFCVRFVDSEATRLPAFAGL